MKTSLLALFLFCFAGLCAYGQDITADTTRANALFEQAQIFKKQSHYDSTLVLYREAAPLYKKHKLWEKYYYTGQQEVWALRSLKQLDEAKALAKNYLNAIKNHLPNSREEGRLLSNLGVIYMDLGAYDEAIEHLQAALVRLKDNKASAASVYNNLALVYHEKQLIAKALECLENSLRLYREAYGEEHLRVAIAYNNIGINYDYQGEYDKALEYYHKGLALKIKLVGENSVSVAYSYVNLAFVYNITHAPQKALTYSEKALPILTEHFGKNHPHIAKNFSALGDIHKLLKNPEKALKAHRKSLSIHLAAYGEKHLEVALVFDDMGKVHQDLYGNYDSAAYFYHQAVKACAWDFESDRLSDNPAPEKAIEKNELMRLLRNKAQALTLLGKEEDALKTYAVAAQCAKLAMFEAQREQDKLDVATRAHPVHTQAAYLHFLRGKRERKKK